MQEPNSPDQLASQSPVVRRKHGCLFWILRIILGLALIPVVLGVFGFIYQLSATQIDRLKYPVPGRLIDIGGYKLHLYCAGSGSPTIILDALFPGTVSNWVRIQPVLAQMTQVCAYDRAGLGWSDSGPEPRDARQHASELHRLLTNGGIPGPYVLVGHSLGGLSVRMFADQYPDEVAGVVLIEGTNPDAWKQLGKPEGVGVDRNQLSIAPFIAQLGIFRLGLIPSYSSDPDLPAQQQMEMQAFFNTAKSFETIHAVDTSFATALDQVRGAKSLGEKPLAIVLGSKGDGSIEQLHDLFIQQAALSTNSIIRVIDGATHAGLVDNQNFASHTSAVINLVIQAVRSGQPLGTVQ